MANGCFPWQASIGAQVGAVDFVQAGKSVTVNGRTFDGPVHVARRTVLGEISFVDLGADGNTSATITAKEGLESGVPESIAKIRRRMS